MTFTTTAFDCSSSWLFEALSCKTTPKVPPSSSAQHALPRFLTQADRFIFGVAPIDYSPVAFRPARHYPRVWIWRSSSERQRDFNPPEQRAAQRTLRVVP